MLITVADQTPNIDNHKYLPTLFTSVVDCFMVFKSCPPGTTRQLHLNLSDLTPIPLSTRAL